ncbi:MAG: hypothetical protein IJ059_02560, partial [Prevotella sp.]|nr:hypothetical protein [Prevotella sp.]
KKVVFTSTSTKSLVSPLFKGVSEGGSELFHFHFTSTFFEGGKRGERIDQTGRKMAPFSQ